ncbi:MAG: sigma factor-like helix-turn-helix DNA-binding protein [Oscillospiraceae bacterium]
MAKNLDVTVLLDFYGDMLTNKQRDFLCYYYNDDLSLSEIAENEGITRQGVRDSIKRAEAQLFEMESRLGLVKRFDEVRTGLEDILGCANEINEYNMRYGLSREINETVVKIKVIAQSLCE